MKILAHFSKIQKDDILQSIAFFSQIFWGPDHETCAEMIRGTAFRWTLELEDIMDTSFSENIKQVVSLIKKFPDGASLYKHLEEAYVRLFVSTKGGIPAPLYQSCYEYENAPLMGLPAIKMKNRLDAIGLSLGEDINEPPDHLSIQLEYLYFLLKKGMDEENRSLISEAGSFASEAMLPWTNEFWERLSVETKYRFYPLISSLLVSILFVIGGRELN